MSLRDVQVLAFCSILFTSCLDTGQNATEIWKNEILETEVNFAKMARKEGIHKAFMAYASENAVLMRRDSLIVGKSGMDNYFLQTTPKNIKVDLSWKPDFIDIASSGDLGYTYGKYVLTLTDSSGQITNRNGVFHTVWKRQADGTWRFVWD